MTIVRGCTGIFSNLLSHAGVQEYFQVECHTQAFRSRKYFLIDCQTRVSMSIFKLNVARRGHGAKNFLIDCHPQVFRNIFKLNVALRGHGAKNLLTVAHKGQGVFSN